MQIIKWVTPWIVLFFTISFAYAGELQTYRLLGAARATPDETGAIILYVVSDKETGRIERFLYSIRKGGQRCDTPIMPDELEKGVTLLTTSVVGVEQKVLEVVSPGFGPQSLNPKEVKLTVLKEYGVFSNTYVDLTLTLAFNRQSHQWELKYKKKVVQSATFLQEGWGIKKVNLGDAKICEESEDGKYVCKASGECITVPL